MDCQRATTHCLAFAIGVLVSCASHAAEKQLREGAHHPAVRAEVGVGGGAQGEKAVAAPLVLIRPLRRALLVQAAPDDEADEKDEHAGPHLQDE